MTNIVVQPEVIKALADCVIDVITNKIDWSTIDWQAVAEKACQRPHGKWIPVSERLPEEGKSVLVCLKTQGGISQYVSERFHENRWSALGGRAPIAWQPLPEPYKEADNDRRIEQFS